MYLDLITAHPNLYRFLIWLLPAYYDIRKQLITFYLHEINILSRTNMSYQIEIS